MKDNNKIVNGRFFMGNEISKYGQENGYVDYRTLAKAFNLVMNNDIFSNTADIGYWDIYCGGDYDEETDEYEEYFQYYIIDPWGAEVLENWTSETVWYNEKLDMYVWGVSHYGTAWDYVLTDIKCNITKGE